MKLKNLLMTIALVAVTSVAAFAEDPKPIFEAFSSLPNARYVYVSPYMLRNSDTGLMYTALNIAVDPKNLKMIEMLRLDQPSADGRLSKEISKIISQNKLELMSKSKGTKNVEWFVKPGKDCMADQLLVVTRNSEGAPMKIIYLVGPMTSQNLQQLLLTL